MASARKPASSPSRSGSLSPPASWEPRLLNSPTQFLLKREEFVNITPSITVEFRLELPAGLYGRIQEPPFLEGGSSALNF
jgi:hypothetical protein